MLIPGLVIGRFLLARIRDVSPKAQKVANSTFRLSDSVRESARSRNALIRAKRRAEKERLLCDAHQPFCANAKEPVVDKIRYEEELIEKDDATADDNENWLPIYRFAYVDSVGVLSRMKLYTTLTGLAIPTLLPYYVEMSPLQFQCSVVLAVVATLSLIVVSRISTRLIGVISLHKEKDLIRVGYLTFWGRRRNAVVPIRNIVPFGDYIDPATLTSFQIKAMPSKFYFEFRVSCSEYAELGVDEMFTLPSIYTTVIQGLSHHWEVYLYPKGRQSRCPGQLRIGIRRADGCDLAKAVPKIRLTRICQASYSGKGEEETRICQASYSGRGEEETLSLNWCHYPSSGEQRGSGTSFSKLSSSPGPADVLKGRFTLTIDIDGLTPSILLSHRIHPASEHPPLRRLLNEVSKYPLLKSVLMQIEKLT